MKRHLLNLLTALSLLVCIGSGGLFLRSLRIHDRAAVATYRPEGPDYRVVQWTLESRAGGMSLVGGAGWSRTRAAPYGPQVVRSSDAYWDGVNVRECFRFTFERLGSGSEWWGYRIAFPIWLLTPLFGAIPANRLYRRLRPKHRPGHCRRCGYDLTGNQRGTCPECGAPGSGNGRA